MQRERERERGREREMLYIYVYIGFALAVFLWTCNAQHYNGAHLPYLYKGTPSIFIREPLLY